MKKAKFIKTATETHLSLHNIANTEFTEVISPVTRHEAIDALCKDKTIVCELEGEFYEYTGFDAEFSNGNEEAVTIDELKDGTWYIGTLENVKRSLEA